MRVQCLLSLGKLLEYMDKWTVLDDILPFLPQVPSKEPAVLMSILGTSVCFLRWQKNTLYTLKSFIC
jgi:SCY1-like protein 2